MLKSRIFLWGLVFLAVSELTIYFLSHDVPLCSLILLNGLSLLLLASGFPDDNWLSMTQVKTKTNLLGDLPSELNSHSSPPSHIKHFLGFKNTSLFFVGGERYNASVDFVEETREAVVKTSVIYLFVLAAFLLAFLQPTEPLSDEATKALEKAKFWSAIIYLAIIFLYWSWQLSPAMFIRKRNRLFVKMDS